MSGLINAGGPRIPAQFREYITRKAEAFFYFTYDAAFSHRSSQHGSVRGNSSRKRNGIEPTVRHGPLAGRLYYVRVIRSNLRRRSERFPRASHLSVRFAYVFVSGHLWCTRTRVRRVVVTYFIRYFAIRKSVVGLTWRENSPAVPCFINYVYTSNVYRSCFFLIVNKFRGPLRHKSKIVRLRTLTTD